MFRSESMTYDADIFDKKVVEWLRENDYVPVAEQVKRAIENDTLEGPSDIAIENDVPMGDRAVQTMAESYVDAFDGDPHGSDDPAEADTAGMEDINFQSYDNLTLLERGIIRALLPNECSSIPAIAGEVSFDAEPDTVADHVEGMAEKGYLEPVEQAGQTEYRISEEYSHFRDEMYY